MQPCISQLKSRDAQNSIGLSPGHVVAQGPPNPTSHVSINAPVLPEDMIDQITEIFDL